VLTLVQSTTGDLRWGFVFVLVNILLPMWGIQRLDLLRGAAEVAEVRPSDAQ
jgi:hypothetical protein